MSLLALLYCGLGSAHAADADVIINEIMYHPPSGQTNLQFVELFNRGATAVDLSNWSFKKGVKFTFPPGTKISSEAYLVVSREPGAFKAHYGQDLPVVGPFSGKLNHKTDTLELCNAGGEVVDLVQYADSGDWAHGADGYSSSLERICPFADGNSAANWAASAWPTAKRAAGTPGRPNDNVLTNLPPVIANVQFSPKAPTPQDRVKVTAQVADSDGVKAVSLVYRLATTGRESSEMTVPMSRNSGDDRDGIYEGFIDPQPQGQLVRFEVKAADSFGTERLQPGPNEPRPTYSYFSYTNTGQGKIPLGHLVNIGRMIRGPAHYQRNPVRRPTPGAGLRGTAAFLYVPADGGPPETFDYVHAKTRSGGYKVHFLKDQPLKGMTGINLILEGPLRWILAEPLSYAVYRTAGVPAPLTEHVRVWKDGRLLGFHLLVEQPNKSFLVRNGRNDSGNLYKLIWYGQGVIGQHEKKTNPTSGHTDIMQLIDGLKRRTGAAQWAFIEQNFNVDECVNYYAVNMCIQNWDGFFNNYFTYHDTGGTGKWEIYPWDEDKTWGDYDGASRAYDWYDMPLTYGMNGDGSPRGSRMFGGGPFGGASWWRPPGYFSGPLLANPEFRRRFLHRLREICLTEFTEENFHPIINAMEKRLEPEVRLRAQAMGQDPQQALREFAGYMQSFRNQVQHRRQVILAQLDKTR